MYGKNTLTWIMHSVVLLKFFWRSKHQSMLIKDHLKIKRHWRQNFYQHENRFVQRSNIFYRHVHAHRIFLKTGHLRFCLPSTRSRHSGWWQLALFEDALQCGNFWTPVSCHRNDGENATFRKRWRRALNFTRLLQTQKHNDTSHSKWLIKIW